MTRTRHGFTGNQPPIQPDIPDDFGPADDHTPMPGSDIALLVTIAALGSFATGFFAAALYYT